jgi:hypothetical protein
MISDGRNEIGNSRHENDKSVRFSGSRYFPSFNVIPVMSLNEANKYSRQVLAFYRIQFLFTEWTLIFTILYIYICKDQRSLLPIKGWQEKREFSPSIKTFQNLLKCRLIGPSHEKNIIWDQDSSGEEKKYFHFFLLHPQLNSSSSIIWIPLVELEIYGTFYIPRCRNMHVI